MSEVKPMSDALVDAYIHDWPNDERTACNGIEVDADELLSMLTRIKSDRAIKAGLVEALKACEGAIQFGLTTELRAYSGAWSGLLTAVSAAIAKAEAKS